MRNIKVLCVTYDYVGPYSSFNVVAGLVRIGEWYDAYEHENRYTIFDESGFVKCDLAKAYFKKIDEIREERLNELLSYN